MGGACYASRMCGRQAAGAACWNNRCCSQHGWCGSQAAYCGSGCQSGPCWRRVANATTAVAAVVTKDAFDHMLPQRGCPARGFYTYEAFVAAAGAFPTFAAAGNADARKKEVAAFLTHSTAGTQCTILYYHYY
jgi:chitinase